MLRRPPTRIDLKVEDLEEWEQVMKEKNQFNNAEKNKPTVEQRIGIQKSTKGNKN